jgi:hypothetical protein
MSPRGRDGGGEVPEPMEGEDLVSLLYGEMDPDEAERTSARVAGDPSMAARLDEMRRVRELFSSMAEEEPPGRISAQLLAEAARVAPQPRRVAPAAEAGLWARFVSWLQPVVQRPALAAAASLVLVAGVAGVLYMKKGEELTSTRTAAEPEDTAPDRATPSPGAMSQPAATPPTANQAADEMTGEAAGGDADQAADAPAEEAAKSEAATSTRSSKPLAKRKKAESPPAGKGAYDKAPAKPSVKSGTVYGLSEQEMVPRDQAQTGAEGGGAVGGAQNKSDDAQAPQAPAPEPAPSTAPAGDGKAAPKQNAQELHKRAIDAALDTRCAEVKMLAGQVRASDAGYYARSFAGDKRLQKCLASPSRAPSKK